MLVLNGLPSNLTKTLITLFFIVTCLTQINQSQANAIYSWKDANGVVHFGDQVSRTKQAKLISHQLKTIKVKRFTIETQTHGFELSEQQDAQIEQSVNLVYQFFQRALNYQIAEPVPVNIRLFANVSQYNQYLRKKVEGIGHTLGVYFRQDHEIVAFMQPSFERTLATLRHETAHAIQHTAIDLMPTWLNEGLAEQMETLTYENGQFVIHQHKGNHSQFSGHQAYSLTQVMDMQNHTFYHTNLSQGAKLQSYSGELIYFMLANVREQAMLKKLLNSYKAGNQRRALFIIEDEYQGGVALMEQNWQQFLRNKRQTSVRI